MPSLPDHAVLRECLRQGHGVTALPGGGCARYVFSEDVTYRRDTDGRMWVHTDRGNASYRDLLQHSGLNLQVVVDRNPDGSESLLLVLTGHLAAPESGVDHRFHVRSAYLEAESGQRTPVALDRLGLACD